MFTDTTTKLNDIEQAEHVKKRDEFFNNFIKSLPNVELKHTNNGALYPKTEEDWIW